MKLYIKNMVCNRCKTIVKTELEKIGVKYVTVELGEVNLKELLVYDDLNLTEIANKMHYSSAAQLSSQFKRITSLTPSHFKLLRHTRINNPQRNFSS